MDEDQLVEMHGASAAVTVARNHDDGLEARKATAAPWCHHTFTCCTASVISAGHRQAGQLPWRPEEKIEIGPVNVLSIIGGTDQALLPSNLTLSYIPAPSALFLSFHFSHPHRDPHFERGLTGCQ